MLILFHSTTEEAAASILESGFSDATGTYLTGQPHTGVWFSDQPLDANEGAKGDALLKVSLGLTEDDIAFYEWIEDGKPYREWLIPADVVNRAATVERVGEAERETGA